MERIVYTEPEKPDLNRLKKYIEKMNGHVGRLQTISGIKVLVYYLGDIHSHEHDMALKVLNWDFPPAERGYRSGYFIIEGKGIFVCSLTAPATDTGKQ